MLKKRIIPCLDVKNGQVVKGVKFEGLKILGDPVAFARHYERSGADELVLYDIGVSLEARQIAASLVTEIKKVFSLPLTVGGGVTVLSDVDRLFESGADKVSINSGAHKTPDLIQQASLKYGRQSIVGSVDTAYNFNLNFYEVVTGGGRHKTGIDVFKWIDHLVESGIGELVVNVIDTDGMQSGFDLSLLSEISNRWHLPIIASGGAGSSQDFISLFKKTYCTGGLAASIFHSGHLEIGQLKSNLETAGIPIRL